MGKLITYKDYRGSIEYSAEDEVFYGKVIGINDLVSFEGTNVGELKESFKESVDDYLDTCLQMDKEPEKEYKGSFNVRVPADLHKMAAGIAAIKNISLNKFVENAIANAVQKESNLLY